MAHDSDDDTSMMGDLFHRTLAHMEIAVGEGNWDEAVKRASLMATITDTDHEWSEKYLQHAQVYATMAHAQALTELAQRSDGASW